MLESISDGMHTVRRTKNKVSAFLFLIFALFGIVVLIYSFVLRKEDKAFFDNAVPVTATISKIEVEEKKDSDGRIKRVYKVYADYEMDSARYKDIYLSNHKNGMSEGDQVEAFCNPADPTDIKIYYDVDEHYNDIVGVSIFFIIVGSMPTIISISRARRERRN